MKMNSPAPRRGATSYHMQNPDLVFDQMNLRSGHVFLDLGCGAGDYALEASRIVGETGTVHVMDVQERSPQMVSEEAARRGLQNVHPHVGDMRAPLPLETASVDVCLIAQVLHVFEHRPACYVLIFREIRRVLRQQSILVVIECKKEDASFGPPLSARVSPEDLILAARTCGFQEPTQHDLGVSYLLRFPVDQEADR
ncbi:MAG: class I SAM-dependent methyltransferase [Rhodospirillales bacterium]|nr:class I SAM-dependent methyltransferase [Rhodospirillales bacterium]